MFLVFMLKINGLTSSLYTNNNKELKEFRLTTERVVVVLWLLFNHNQYKLHSLYYTNNPRTFPMKCTDVGNVHLYIKNNSSLFFVRLMLKVNRNIVFTMFFAYIA